MEEQELLDKCKKGLGITGTYQDDTLKIYIDEVKEYMLDAGVPEQIVNSKKAVGTIIRGVSDLWDYGSGKTSLSPYFYERVNQLRVGVDNV